MASQTSNRPPPPPRDYVKIAKKYAKDVVSGRIPAGQYVKLACQRQLDDLERKYDKNNWPYVFDDTKAYRPCKFLELMPHMKGKWAGKPLMLEPWQIFILTTIFGWVKKADGKRRFRRAMVLVPRKNGKSLLAAGVGLYMLVADGEAGAEVYAGATSEKQAYEVFRPATYMAQNAPNFKQTYGVEVYKSNIIVPKKAARFEPLIGKPGDGSSPSCSIHDEYHEHPNSDQVETMETGMGAREQPLLFIITTAGNNIAGPCYDDQKDLQKVLHGTFKRDTLFGIIYGIDEEDDWTKPETLIKANPNYGISVSEEFLRNQQAVAKANARKQGAFKTKHLNVWVTAREAFYNIEDYKACKKEGIKPEDYAQYPCYLGLDLASKDDIAALEMLFVIDKDRYARFGKYYLPYDTAYESGKDHYHGWANSRWITTTDGNIIDFDYIIEDIKDIATQFSVQQIAYDPHQATMLATTLMNNGLPVIEYRPTVLNFSEPMKTLDALLKSRQLEHNGDPVFEWMLGNVVAKEDAKDNVYPRKEFPENKIDGVVACIMALGVALQRNDYQQVSIYETSEIEWI